MPGLAAIQNPAPFVARHSVALEDAVTDIAWCPDDEALIAGTAAGYLHRLGIDGRRLLRWQAHRGGVIRLALQPGQPTLASAGEDGCVTLWDARSGTREAVLATESAWVEHLAWTPDGDVLAAAASKTISLWRGAESLGLWYDARRQVLAMGWAPDGRRLATAANKGLYLWRMDDAQRTAAEPMQLLSFPGAPVALAWRGDSRALAVGTQDGLLQIWLAGNTKTKARQLTMRGYPGKVGCLAWHPRHAHIATAGGRDVVLWDLPASGGSARGRPLRLHQATITALRWSGDGRFLASADRSGRLCIWDQDGDAVLNLPLGVEVVTMAWHPADRVLAVGDTDGRLHLLERQPDDGQPNTLTTA